MIMSIGSILLVATILLSSMLESNASLISSMTSSRKYDVIVHGATGFTGKLVVKYLAEFYPSLRWCIAGRNETTLNEVKALYKADVDVYAYDINDAASLDAVLSQGTVLIACAGPFMKVGLPMIDACVRNSVHYVDITGEPNFCKAAIDKYHDEAKAKQLKIVNTCGFDCVPADIGVDMIMSALIKDQDVTPIEGRYYVDDASAGLSGGTIATVFEMLSNKDNQREKMQNPYYLCPEVPSDASLIKRNSDFESYDYDSVSKAWMAPFMMQMIDTRIVHRSNYLKNWVYGKNFLYGERAKVSGWLSAFRTSFIGRIVGAMFRLPFIINIAKRIVPQPGQGPSETALKTGFFKIKLWAKGVRKSDKSEVCITGGVTAVNGDMYKYTAVMVVESALCMVLNKSELPQTFGVLTPSSAFGPVLRKRLSSKGVDFYVDSGVKTA